MNAVEEFLIERYSALKVARAGVVIGERAQGVWKIGKRRCVP